ncbi:Cdc6/Cdc18 family protein [Natronobacterium gregoryi]|uniref:Transcriptional regulator n=2 Tax=Natronobacterium gregoryi TaxID=44930 RepID=L0AKY5_NATGS|nr:hypothetical protein [Natronobacterium gregoryi]AFZ73847.1 hypothetical protein Natgr_2698 [Natronobacterium gregoryi SP2]ELY65093.1 hypothetical protein C490_14025 [Natronobacterium gregoryi SP2]PLK19697.1 hypothetical protein CYV19_13365 [Natronobacterium gregoryi SP2]SFJ42413.1 hypothetical protein SAMN05443661_12836 [Natronobacterium gregoryi]
MATESTPEIDSIPPLEQVVLLGIATLDREDETPVRTPTVRRVCRNRITGDETRVVGSISEADVIRALYRLEDDGLVDETEPDQTSPTGKGRPAYELAVDPTTVFGGVDDELTGE